MKNKPEEQASVSSKYPAGRLVIQYLLENRHGATAAEIVRHLQQNCGKDPEELGSMVETLLENGTMLGFLERKGSHYVNWAAREACGRKRRRKSCGRHKRKRRSRRRR